MQEYLAKRLTEATWAQVLLQFNIVNGFEEAIDKPQLKEEAFKQSCECLSELNKECAFLGLTLTKLSSERFLRDLKADHEMEDSTYKTNVAEVISRFRDELESKKFFYISSEASRYFEESRKMFGDEVEQAFPSIIAEIEEAGKCLALQRCTASVFHLMRIMEVGLKVLARHKELGIPYAPSWESYLSQIDAKLTAKYKSKSKKWKSVEPFFKEAAAHLSAVKFAWRNPTMHIVRNYTFDEAESIFQSVRTFMKHLATELKE